MIIHKINGQIHDLSYGGYPYRIEVTVTLPVEDFRRYKGDLGNLVLEVNNAVYAFNSNIPAHSPNVDGISNRAKKGIKQLTFRYFLSDHVRAEALGFELLKLRNGEVLPKYGQYISIERETK